jgi:hypothetical protein
MTAMMASKKRSTAVLMVALALTPTGSTGMWPLLPYVIEITDVDN